MNTAAGETEYIRNSASVTSSRAATDDDQFGALHNGGFAHFAAPRRSGRVGRRRRAVAVVAAVPRPHQAAEPATENPFKL